MSLALAVQVVNFWATWCEPCRHEVALLQRLHREYQSRGVAITGVAMDERGWRSVTPFLIQHGIEYPVILFHPKMTRTYGRVEVLPRTLFLDRHGCVVAQVDTVLDERTLRRLLDLLLSAPKGSECDKPAAPLRSPHSWPVSLRRP